MGQALSRLAKAGKIRRIRQGLYDLPRPHPVTGQTAPDSMAAVRALMEGSSAQWQVSGAYAANLLGLSEQVPGRIVVLTNQAPSVDAAHRATSDRSGKSMKNVLELTLAQRRELFVAASQKLGYTAPVVKKDF